MGIKFKIVKLLIDATIFIISFLVTVGTTLKIGGTIDVSWLWIMSPIWGSGGLLVLIIILVMIFNFLKVKFK